MSVYVPAVMLKDTDVASAGAPLEIVTAVAPEYEMLFDCVPVIVQPVPALRDIKMPPAPIQVMLPEDP